MARLWRDRRAPEAGGPEFGRRHPGLPDVRGSSGFHQALRWLFRPMPAPQAGAPDAETVAALAARLEAAAQRRLGRGLALRHVNAGSCNGCELELRALDGALYDLQRFGLRFVDSPRHADVLLVTGPLTRNLRAALEQAYDVTPDPKWVVAIGDCAVDGGVFKGSYAILGGAGMAVPVDLTIGGCPPPPERILSGLRSLLEANDAGVQAGWGEKPA